MNKKTADTPQRHNLAHKRQLSKIINSLDFLSIHPDAIIGVPFSRENTKTIKSALIKIQKGLEKIYHSKFFLIIALGENSSNVQISHILPPKAKNIKFYGLHKHKNLIGKGWSIRTFVDIASHFNSHAVFFDADVTNIKYKWIKILLEPLFIKKKNYCIIPVVHREAHDAETTNSLAFPLLSALYKKAPRHPLGGLRSFTSDIAKQLASFTDAIGNTAWFCRNISGYGIDIFYTIFSLKFGALIKEPYLGRVSHSSLPVVDDGYKKAITQIIGGLFGFLDTDSGNWILTRTKIKKCIKKLRRPDMDALAYLNAFKDSFSDSSAAIKKIINPKIFTKIENCYQSDNKDIYLPADQWAKIVYAFILYFHRINSNKKKKNAIEAIYPIYCLRIGSFFRELRANASAIKIENAVGHISESFRINSIDFIKNWKKIKK